MSHYTCMVIGEDPEEQLSPFDENLDTPRYVKFTKDEAIAKGRQDIENYKNGTYAEYLADPEKYSEGITNEGHLNYLKNEFPKKLEWSDEEVFQDFVKYEDDVDEDGNIYSEYNPNSKWDWYVLGGRWTGMLKLKSGTHGATGEPGLMTKMTDTGWVDQARKKDIDFEGMMEHEFEKRSKIYDNFLENWNDLEKRKTIHPYFEYGIKGKNEGDEFIPETKEEYLHRQVPFSTFAVLKDGKWYEKGEMGWWASVSNEKDLEEWIKQFNELLNSLDDNTLISIYDCHI